MFQPANFRKSYHVNNIFRRLIDFAEDGDGYLWHGILFASAYFLVGVVHTLQETMSDNVSHTLALKIRTSVCGAIYRKVRIQQQTIYLEESFDFF